MKYGVNVRRTREVVEEKNIIIEADSPEQAGALAIAQEEAAEETATYADDFAWLEFSNEHYTYSSTVEELGE